MKFSVLLLTTFYQFIVLSSTKCCQIVELKMAAAEKLNSINQLLKEFKVIVLDSFLRGALQPPFFFPFEVMVLKSYLLNFRS